MWIVTQTDRLFSVAIPSMTPVRASSTLSPSSSFSNGNLYNDLVVDGKNAACGNHGVAVGYLTGSNWHAPASQDGTQ